MLAARGRALPIPLPIPLLWYLLSDLTLWAMNNRQAWLPLLAMGIFLVALGLRYGNGTPSASWSPTWTRISRPLSNRSCPV